MLAQATGTDGLGGSKAKYIQRPVGLSFRELDVRLLPDRLTDRAFVTEDVKEGSLGERFGDEDLGLDCL
jgi:hypothetical protein